jgi:formamidase
VSPGTRIRIDASRPLSEEPGSGHNRWHPGIPPIATVRPGEEITLETRDGLDCALGPDSTVEDVLQIDLRLPHPLTGPVYVEGAEPGDVLAVEIVSLESAPFGSTCIVPGFGFLADVFTEPYLVKWRIADGVARSNELPGVAIPADMFPGVIGVAPSLELVEETRRREDELRERGGAVADDAPEMALPALAGAGLRTIPPRETGGNMDVRGLVAGSTAYFPVHVPGALFSVGDLHFAQGDGESCGVAIEIAGAVTVRFDVRKGAGWPLRFPAYETPARAERRCFATTGLPVTPEGRNESLDLNLATRTALLEMIAYLGHEHGLAPQQAYVLVSVAVDLRLSEIVDVPNPLVSALLPLDIFEA